MGKARLLVAILSTRRYRAAALIALAVYIVLYLGAMQYLLVQPGRLESFVALDVLPDWRSLAFRPRGPFLFEPIGALQIGPLAVFLSIPNLVIALALGALVGTNVAASYYAFRALGMRGFKGLHSLVGTIPALIGGAACCVPTLVLVIGLQMTATLVAAWAWLIPLSAALLAVSLWWSLHRIHAEGFGAEGDVCRVS